METQMSLRQFHLPRLLQFEIGGKICTPNNYENNYHRRNAFKRYTS